MRKEQKNTLQLSPALLVLVVSVVLISLVLSIVSLVQTNAVNATLNSFIAQRLGSNDSGGARPTPSGNNAPAGNAPDQAVSCVSGNIDLNSDPSYGDPNAPVTIVEYSDFECPFCARFITGAYPRLRSEYIDSGQVRIIFKDFPLDNIHELAVPAALAANCVYNIMGDSAFFNYHDRLFLQQTALSERNIVSWAVESGLSEAQVNSCLNNGAMRDEIFADRAEGIELGINGTPSFVVNGELLVGAQPFEVFQEAIERARSGNSSCSL